MECAGEDAGSHSGGPSHGRTVIGRGSGEEAGTPGVTPDVWNEGNHTPPVASRNPLTQ